MHVRRTELYVAKRRGFESTVVQGVSCYTTHSKVSKLRVQTIIVRQIIRELESGFTMAVKAIGPKLPTLHNIRIAPFFLEELVTSKFGLSEDVLSTAPFVEFRIGGDHCS